MEHTPGENIAADDEQLAALRAALDFFAMEKRVWEGTMGAIQKERYESFWRELFPRGYILHSDTVEHFIEMGLPRLEIETTFALLFY